MTNRGCAAAPRRIGAFTLVELLVSMSVLAVLMLLVTQVIGQVQKVWSQSNSRVSQFREARTAFDLLTHNLSQAVLNPYWDTNAGGLSGQSYANRASQIPTRYLRKADLQFVSGKAVNLVKQGPTDAQHLPFHAVFFQAPLGVTQIPDLDKMQTLLCGRGYFVQYGDDAGFRPPFVTQASNRYRLMEYSPTAEQNAVYSDNLSTLSSGTLPPDNWFADAGRAVDRSTESSAAGGNTAVAVVRGFTRPIAENIVALVIGPRISDRQATIDGKNAHWIATDYQYDSTQVKNQSTNQPQGTQNLLPPLLDVIMVAVDEATQNNFTTQDSSDLQSLFTDATRMDSDLQALQGLLVNRAFPKKPVNFRIFKTTVEIRSARWSL